jgi:hydrocephalus-inducing protein
MPVTHQLAVKNWLNHPQRFKVLIECPEKEATTTVGGLDYIDVPALGERQYKLNFHAFKEGVTNIKITFLNESTKEYLFFNISFTTTPPEIVQTIDLETPVRRAITHLIPIHNPLKEPANFTISCENTEISAPSSVAIPAGFDWFLLFYQLALQDGRHNRVFISSVDGQGRFQMQIYCFKPTIGGVCIRIKPQVFSSWKRKVNAL